MEFHYNIEGIFILILEEHMSKALKLMSSYESMISELYQKFADIFPEHYDFWSDLSDDEIEHSSWIITLSEDIDAGFLKIKKSAFSDKLKRETVGHLEDLLENLPDDISLAEACDIALSIEQHMLEREYISLFDGEDEALEELAENLAIDTRQHVRNLIEFRDEFVKK